MITRTIINVVKLIFAAKGVIKVNIEVIKIPIPKTFNKSNNILIFEKHKIKNKRVLTKLPPILDAKYPPKICVKMYP